MHVSNLQNPGLDYITMFFSHSMLTFLTVCLHYLPMATQLLRLEIIIFRVSKKKGGGGKKHSHSLLQLTSFININIGIGSKSYGGVPSSMDVIRKDAALDLRPEFGEQTQYLDKNAHNCSIMFIGIRWQWWRLV